MTSCSQLSESKFHTCMSSFCSFEEVTIIAYGLLMLMFPHAKRTTQKSLKDQPNCTPHQTLSSFPPFASPWDCLHCKSHTGVQEANAVACTPRQHAVRKQQQHTGAVITSTKTGAKGDNLVTVTVLPDPSSQMLSLQLHGFTTEPPLLGRSSLPISSLLQSGFILRKERKGKFQEKDISNTRHRFKSFSCRLSDAATHPVTLPRPAKD